MALNYILTQVGNKIGKNPALDGDRKVMLRFVQEAARELYAVSDMAGCYDEQYFKVNSNQTIELPDYVGQIRAMRESETIIAIKLSQMRPRFNQIPWPDEYRTWRILGLQTLQTTLKNQSELVLGVSQVENPPVVVNISGSSDGSAMISESVTMDAITKTTVNHYNDVSSFTKNTVNSYNIILSDIDGNQISYLANNKLKASFQIIDISTAPWFPAIASPLLGWVEVLYKRALPWFSNDNDEFPAVGYDDVIVNGVLQLWYEEQGNVQGAMAWMQKKISSLAAIHEDMNRGTDDVVSMVRNGHDDINPRVGFGRDWRWAYRIQGR